MQTFWFGMFRFWFSTHEPQKYTAIDENRVTMRVILAAKIYMAEGFKQDITQMLVAWGDGDKDALNRDRKSVV